MIGVSFQPGANQDVGQTGPNASRPQTNGVQEAIKVLSLRLPKVVGAQAVSPMPLLTSQGAGGNPRVDSIVQQVMARFKTPQMPSAGMPAMPQMPTQMSARDNGPTFSNTPRQQAPAPYAPQFLGPQPRVVVENPSVGDFSVGADGRPMNAGGYGAMISEPPPNFNAPQAPSFAPASPWQDLANLNRRDQPAVDPIPFEQPLF